MISHTTKPCGPDGSHSNGHRPHSSCSLETALAALRDVGAMPEAGLTADAARVNRILCHVVAVSGVMGRDRDAVAEGLDAALGCVGLAQLNKWLAPKGPKMPVDALWALVAFDILAPEARTLLVRLLAHDAQLVIADLEQCDPDVSPLPEQMLEVSHAVGRVSGGLLERMADGVMTGGEVGQQIIEVDHALLQLSELRETLTARRADLEAKGEADKRVPAVRAGGGDA